MQELVKINNEQGKQTVSARELYTFLEVSERFSNWFERQKQFGFIENQDFTSVKTLTVVNNGATRQLDDYALTLDCAKEISMVQRSEKGKEARLYFIECEKKLKEVATALPNFNDPYEAAIAWANEYKAKQEALTELGEVKNQLENVTIALDAHENWLSILAVSIANNINEKSLDWRKLKSKSAQMGYIIKTAPCPRFKMRNLYHIDVFRAVYPKLHLSGIRDMNILA